MSLPSDQQRHQDFTSLQDTIQGVKKAILATIIPLLGGGLLVLVANNYEQKNIAREVAELNGRLKNITDKLDRVNEKVIVMWAGGEWEARYGSGEKK